MTIQQVAGSSNNGIMSFLFQDDGSMEGTVLEGAEFARTLHQLLGEDGAPTDAAPAEGQLASEQTATPLSAELDALAGDFALPTQDPELQAETDGDEPDAGKAMWNMASFADMIGMHHANANGEVSTDTSMHDDAAALARATQQGHADAAARATDTAVAIGIEQAIALARSTEQVVVQPPLASQQALPATGRSAPASGKFLPQGFRPTNALGQAMAGATARSAQAANVAFDAAATGGAESAFSSAFNNDFLSEMLGTDARTPQNGTNASTPNLVQGLGAARMDNPLPAAAKAAAESAPLPHFDSPYLAGSDAWFEDLGTRLEWLNEMNIDKAELQLHPAELGLLEIQIANGDEGTSVSFVTHNPEARALIEENMPKLRELLAHQGLQLGDSQVSQQSGQQRDSRDMSGMPSGTRPDSRVEDEAPARRTVYIRDPSRIDHYV